MTERRDAAVLVIDERQRRSAGRRQSVTQLRTV